MVDVKEMLPQVLSYFEAMVGTNLDVLELYFADNIGIDFDGDVIFGKLECLKWFYEQNVNFEKDVTLLEYEELEKEKYKVVILFNQTNKYEYLFSIKNEKITGISFKILTI